MLIVEEESNPEIFEEKAGDSVEKKPHRKYREEDYYYDKHHRKNHYCLKSFGCFLLFLVLIAVVIYGAFKFVIGPVVIATDKLPADFPQELVLNNIGQAKIKIQSPAEKENLNKIINYIPKWLPAPILSFFSTNPSTQLAQKSDEGVGQPEKVNLDTLKNYLNNPDSKNSKTVSVSWSDINRKKDELTEFYRKQLIDKGFEFKLDQNPSTNNVDLSFWKDNVYGIIKIGDDLINKGASKADITINYPSK